MDKGLDNYEAYFGKPRALPPSNEFEKLTISHLFGKIYERAFDKSLTAPLDLRDRALVNVAILVALGRQEEFLEHLPAAFHQGLGHDLLVEVLIHVAHYAGWPAGHWAMKELEGAVTQCAIPDTGRSDDFVLRELNTQMVEWEQKRDTLSIENLDRVLSPALVFRRADATVVDKVEFMRGLHDSNRYKSREASEIAVHVLGLRALVTLIVAATKPTGETLNYRNVRFLARRDGRWQVESWFNEEIKAD